MGTHELVTVLPVGHGDLPGDRVVDIHVDQGAGDGVGGEAVRVEHAWQVVVHPFQNGLEEPSRRQGEFERLLQVGVVRKGQARGTR